MGCDKFNITIKGDIHSVNDFMITIGDPVVEFASRYNFLRSLNFIDITRTWICDGYRGIKYYNHKRKMWIIDFWFDTTQNLDNQLHISDNQDELFEFEDLSNY